MDRNGEVGSVPHEREITSLLAVAVDLDRESAGDPLHHDRDDARVRSGVLPGTVVVERPHHGRVDAEGLDVGPDDVVLRRLRCGVRRDGVVGVSLVHGHVAPGTVCLGAGHVHEALDETAASDLAERGGDADVGQHGPMRIVKRRRQRHHGEVEDGLDLVGGHDILHGGEVGRIEAEHFEVWIALRARRSGSPRCRGRSCRRRRSSGETR